MEPTKKVLQQYEEIRQSGEANMYDYYAVNRIATRRNFYELGSLTREDYKGLLLNFQKLMKKYDIKQGGSN